MEIPIITHYQQVNEQHFHKNEMRETEGGASVGVRCVWVCGGQPRDVYVQIICTYCRYILIHSAVIGWWHYSDM